MFCIISPVRVPVLGSTFDGRSKCLSHSFGNESEQRVLVHASLNFIGSQILSSGSKKVRN